MTLLEKYKSCSLISLKNNASLLLISRTSVLPPMFVHNMRNRQSTLPLRFQVYHQGESNCNYGGCYGVSTVRPCYASSVATPATITFTSVKHLPLQSTSYRGAKKSYIISIRLYILLVRADVRLARDYP